MSWSVDPIALMLACACLCVALAVLRSNETVSLADFEDALERVRRGETGVRVEPSTWGRSARVVSRFNSALAEIEAGTFDWEHANEQDRTIFGGLRKDEPATGRARGYVAIVKINRFSALRHSVGYQLANQLLAKMADRIRTTIPTAEIGRVGRTTIEFAFHAGSTGQAQTQLLDAIESLEQSVSVGEYSFELSVTIGFADATTGSIREELIDQAAAALSAGQSERVKVSFASAAVLSGEGRADLELMRAVPKALAAGEFTLHYQPKLDARTNSIRSVEALLRWTHPERGLISTEQLIRIAEETGVIHDVTEWVISRAVADQKRLAEAGHDIEVYVNISGQLLPNKNFSRKALELVSTAVGQMGFEITETAVIGDPDAALANLRDFTEAGIKIAIDDYGSGLSSLAYLKQLPAHELKIDRMFVSGLADSNRDPLLVRSSIDLAHALEMVVTAEGVDDAMAMSLLRVMGCDMLQGYLISPPLPWTELLAFLNDESQIARISSPADGSPWALVGNA